MRGFWAALGKDLRLLRNGTGLVCLLLPLALLLALRTGVGDLAGRAYLEPFPIAVRDEDGTVMSRSLTGQMEDVALFSRVVRAREESDQALLDAGCAGVITLPKDFFYTLYDMRENTVRVTLNGEMPLEASVLRSVFTSVMEIISADQAAARGVFRFCYGELTPQRERELWETASARLIRDALGRQNVFDETSRQSDLRGSVERGLMACAVSVLCLFFCLAGVKTLPEEMALGVLPRFLAAGGRPLAFFLSKLFSAAAATLPAGALLLALYSERWPLTLLLMGVLFLGAFGGLLFVAVWAGRADAAQRWGNLILLLELTLGGAIYPRELLPGFTQALGRLTLPYYARLGLESIHSGGGAAELLAAVWPVAAAGAALGGVAAGALRRSGRGRTPELVPPAAERQDEPFLPRPRRVRLAAVTLRKILAMSGGRTGLVCVMAASLVCGTLAASALGRAAPDSLRLAVTAPADDPLAQGLAERLSGQEGVTVEEVTAERGQALLGRGEVEGLLEIAPGYGEALERGETPGLVYFGAASAVSDQAAREIIAGQVAGQRAVLRGVEDAGARLGRALTGDERGQLERLIAQEAEDAPALYRVEVARGAPLAAAGPFAPSPLGFAALVVTLTALTWGAWAGGADQRLVEVRMASLPGGRRLAYGSDILALELVTLGAGVCALLPGGGITLWRMAALAGCVHCVVGMALAVGRFSAANARMDTLAGFLALITCLLGGCFTDLSRLSPGLQRLSLLTPQGLALRVGAGEAAPLAALLLAGTALLYLGRPRRS